MVTGSVRGPAARRCRAGWRRSTCARAGTASDRRVAPSTGTARPVRRTGRPTGRRSRPGCPSSGVRRTPDEAGLRGRVRARRTTGACCWCARAASRWPGWPGSGSPSPRSASGTCRAGPRPAGRASSGSPGAATTRPGRPTRRPPTTPRGSSATARGLAGRHRRRPRGRRRGARRPAAAARLGVVGPWLAVPDPRRGVLEQAVRGRGHRGRSRSTNAQ